MKGTARPLLVEEARLARVSAEAAAECSSDTSGHGNAAAVAAIFPLAACKPHGVGITWYTQKCSVYWLVLGSILTSLQSRMVFPHGSSSCKIWWFLLTRFNPTFACQQRTLCQCSVRCLQKHWSHFSYFFPCYLQVTASWLQLPRQPEYVHHNVGIALVLCTARCRTLRAVQQQVLGFAL